MIAPTSIANEMHRRGAATPQVRAAMARGARLLCEREHVRALERGRIGRGVPCCPHCVVVKAVAG